MSTVITLREGTLRRLLHDERGSVGLLLQRFGKDVTNRAKWYASGNAGGPNVRTGELRRSLTSKPTSIGGELAVLIGSNKEYAGFVERGTSRMYPRPYLVPALIDVVGR